MPGMPNMMQNNMHMETQSQNSINTNQQIMLDGGNRKGGPPHVDTMKAIAEETKPTLGKSNSWMDKPNRDKNELNEENLRTSAREEYFAGKTIETVEKEMKLDLDLSVRKETKG
jgi:hypothetical protein